MNQIPLNPMEDGTCRPIKSQYWKNSLANFVRGGSYGATAVAVLDSRTDMEEQTKRTSVRPNGNIPMLDGRESRRSRAKNSSV